MTDQEWRYPSGGTIFMAKNKPKNLKFDLSSFRANEGDKSRATGGMVVAHYAYEQYAWEKFNSIGKPADCEWVLWKKDKEGVLKPVTPRLKTMVVREIISPDPGFFWDEHDFETFIDRCKDKELVELTKLVVTLKEL